MNNGVLPIQVSAEFLEKLFKSIKLYNAQKITVDLEKQELRYNDQAYQFEINPYKKDCLLNGFDDIDYLINKKEKIQDFEG